MNTKAIFIIFGEAIGLENTIVGADRQPFNGTAAKSRSDTAGRKKTAQPRPDIKIARLEFAEFVNVDPMDPLAQPGWQRQYRDLNHVVER